MSKPLRGGGRAQMGSVMRSLPSLSVRQGQRPFLAAHGHLTDEYEDLVKSGVIDPTKVTTTALSNAASVSILLLTSDALIAEKPKKGKGHGHGGDSDMY